MPEERPPSSSGARPRASAPTAPSAAEQSQALGIGKYRLLAELGRGGMADVFLAMTAGPGGFNKLLVIKQLRVGDDPNMVAMFLDEARLAARVSHPNIVQTFEVVHEGARAFMVMEFLDGPSLSRLRRAAVKKGQRVPLGIELKILSDALLGLHYAHELRGYDDKPLGVVHRDFTPQNVMITYGGDTKIVDFGIAKALDQQTQTSAGMFKGKLTYVPPEQLMAQTIDRRADVFSAGVMLFEAVTGFSPWKDLTNAAVTHALASGRIPRLMESADAPPELAAICDQAMAVDPDDRYSTADELRRALDDFARDHELAIDRLKLGEYVISMLGDARDRTREVIDSQLKQMNALPSADTLTQALPTLDGYTPSPPAKVVGRSLPALMASEALPDTGQVPRSTSSGVAPQPASSRTAAIVGALVGVVVVLVAIVAFLLTRTTTPTSAPIAAEPVAVAPAPPAAVAPPPAVLPEPPLPAPAAKISVRIRANPASARLVLDGLELPSNPFAGEFSQDAVVHELLVSAPGYLSVRRGVQFERDATVDVTLARAIVAAPAPRPAPTPKPAEPRPPAEPKSEDPEYFPPASAVKKQPKRPLDSNIEFH